MYGFDMFAQPRRLGLARAGLQHCVIRYDIGLGSEEPAPG